MSEYSRPVTLADIKRLVARFAAAREGRERDDIEAEYGELLLFLISAADKAGVDLFAGASRQIDRRSKTMPRSVSGDDN